MAGQSKCEISSSRSACLTGAIIARLLHTKILKDFKVHKFDLCSDLNKKSCNFRDKKS